MFPRMLYSSEYHWRSFLTGSDTCTHPSVSWFCRCLVSSARNAQTFGGKNKNNSDYDAFPSHELQVFFEDVSSLNILKYVYPWPLIVLVCHHLASFFRRVLIL